MRIGVLGGEARDLVNFRGHLLGEMATGGHVVFGIAPRGNPEIRASLEALGAAYVPVTFNRTGLNPLKDLAAVIRLWRRLRELQLDILLTYEVKGVVFGTLAGRVAGVSRRFAMITGRGTTLQGRHEGLRDHLITAIVKWLYRLALRRTNGVLFQNGDDREFFADQGLLPPSTPWKIINGSGVDLDHFAFAPLPEGAPTFLLVGRLLRNKGIFEFVEASRLFRASGAKGRFLLLGPLDDNPNGIRMEQIEAWTGAGLVEYLGEAKDVRSVLALAHVLVLPSYGEGTPRSVLEAMSMGRAIVTTHAPGCRETVKDGVNGYLVPVGDSAALADAMKNLAADPRLIAQFGWESRRMAEVKYDVRLVSGEIQDFMGTRSPKVENRPSQG